MAKLPNPVIVLPGITGTYLSDQYMLPPDFCFTLMRKMFDRIALHPDDLRYEAHQPSKIVPDQLFELVYKEIIQELRHNLTEDPEEPVPVFPFAYDWRQPLSTVTEQFGAFVDEVIDRTKLLRHYFKDGYPDTAKVNLVGHSMGGLIIAGYLRTEAGNAKVERIASLGTPFNGSYEGVMKIMTGTAALGGGDSASREREMARLTPGLYHLMPRFKPVLPTDENPAPAANLFPSNFLDPGAHQAGIVETIATYIERYGVGRIRRPELPTRAADLFAELLTGARKFRDGVDALDGTALDLPERWLCVAGVGSETRVRLRLRAASGAPDYDLTSHDRENQWGSTAAGARWELTGDGTVPFQGAVPKFLDVRNVVCVTPADFGYWEEIGDRAIAKAAGFHASLPNMDLLHRLVVAHFIGAKPREGQHWGRPGPGVAPADWKPALAKLPAK